jgi:integrase
MDFLKKCASDLDNAVPSHVVLEAMRSRYKTVRSLNVKTCLVRGMCTPTREYQLCEDLLLGCLREERPELVDQVASDLRRGYSKDPEIRRWLAAFPRRLPDDVYRLKVSRKEQKECKRLSIQGEKEKNRRRRRVQGRELLDWARSVCESAECPNGNHAIVELSLALMVLTGRRTCELLNGRSQFADMGHTTHGLRFTGQAKVRGQQRTYCIPVLTPAPTVLKAIARLRSLQENERLTNKETSLKYQYRLHRHSSQIPCLQGVGKVHNLRGVYVCMVVRLFAWEESDAYVAMSVLGHAGLHESLVYTPFDLGGEFSAEPSLATDAASIDLFCGQTV